MIRVTRLDGTELYLNAEFIQSVESTPDTHVVLMNGHSYIVQETDHEIVDRVMEYRDTAYSGGSCAKPPLHLLGDEKTG